MPALRAMSKAAERVAAKERRARVAPLAKPRCQADDAFAKVFAALGEATRLKIMQMLPREPVCEQMYNVIELAEELGLTQPTVSHHLKILSEAGLVLCRRQCNSLYFYVNQPVVIEWLGQTRCKFGCEGRGGSRGVGE